MTQPPPPHSSHGVHLPRYALWIFGIVCVLPWLVLLYLGRDLLSTMPAATPRRAPARATTAPKVFHCQPGPWGDLEYSRIVIEPPESLIDLSEITPRPAVWNFKGYTPEKLAALWQSTELTAAQRLAIDERRYWEPTADGVLMRPTPDFVLGLSPATRTKIYSVLSAFDENPDQKEPFRFRSDGTAEWFKGSELSAATQALVERLLYRRGSSLLLSDASVVLASLNTSQERIQLIKTLARKSTLLVKLRVHPDTDFEGLDNYWDRGRRTKDLQPLLQSLVRESDGMTIDIIHLLPRLPRSLLYTYPAADEAGTNSYLDCHWTVLNFFNLRPDDRYQHIEAVTAAILHDYHLVAGKRTFGDILLFARPDGTIIHSCVYVADDIVFTKNGSSQNSPWILMNLADVIAYYPTDTPIDVQVYRAKKPGISDAQP